MLYQFYIIKLFWEKPVEVRNRVYISYLIYYVGIFFYVAIFSHSKLPINAILLILTPCSIIWQQSIFQFEWRSYKKPLKVKKKSCKNSVLFFNLKKEQVIKFATWEVIFNGELKIRGKLYHQIFHLIEDWKYHYKSFFCLRRSMFSIDVHKKPCMDNFVNFVYECFFSRFLFLRRLYLSVPVS